jgi:hypothetical protein
MRNATLLLLLAAACFAVASGPAAAANIVLVNLDPPGSGLNDPTPAAPVGGNPGTTLGEQRVNVYNLAAQIWGAVLDSDVPVFVGATFQPLPCAPTGGVLGSAGTTSVISDFAGAQVPATWYHSALADAQSGVDQVPGDIDIISFFNSDIDDDDPNCLTGRTWYYGFDNDEGIDFDFLSVVLHEIAHGLGFSEFASENSGALFLGLPSIYARFMADLAQGGAIFADMTDAERLAAQVSTDNLVWTGVGVNAAAPGILGPRPTVRILNPKSIAGAYEAQAATFGPPLEIGGGTTGKMVLADDGTDVPSDACEPILNNLSGKMAVVDRGGCTFVSKVLNAQFAGAKGVIVVNNQPGGRPPMGGASPDVMIPSVGISRDDGDAIKAVLPGNSVSKLVLDPDFLAGATADGWVRLYAPDPVQPGSSKSHWDTAATPNLLMEPSINSDLESATNLDLTPFLFMDIGWQLLP